MGLFRQLRQAIPVSSLVGLVLIIYLLGLGVSVLVLGTSQSTKSPPPPVEPKASNEYLPPLTENPEPIVPQETETSPVVSTTISPTKNPTPTPDKTTQEPEVTPTHTQEPTPEPEPEKTPIATEEPTPDPSPSATCASRPGITFTHHVTDLSKILQIVSPPTIAGGHLKTHGYFQNKTADAVPVYAPTDATLDTGILYADGNPGGAYGLTFRASCDVKFRFGHITQVIPEIKAVLNQTPNTTSQDVEPSAIVTVKAGQQIGATTGTTQAHSWDYGVYNATIQNRYATNPSWNTSWVYTTAICPWAYYSTPMYSQITALFGSLSGNPPDGEPFCPAN